jgi:hypothetical protein
MSIEDRQVTREVVLDVGLGGLPVDRIEERRIVMVPNHGVVGPDLFDRARRRAA